jgi:cold shock CspA family protein
MSTETSTTRYIGQVKWFKKGIGFICNLETKQDIFVHHSQLKTKTECYRALFEGEFVSYSISDTETTSNNNNKKQAVNVTGINYFPLMCEVKTRVRPDNVENSSTR